MINLRLQGRTWYFSAESEIVRDLWVAAFRAIVQE